VSAPAGYGKTTLVSTWLNQPDVHSTWFSLDEGDNDPLRFLQYFLTALQKLVPAVRVDMLDMLQAVEKAPYNGLMSLLINQIAENADNITTDFIVILDDFHIIHDQAILDMLNFLIEHLPSRMHILLLSRSDPPLQISRLRARNQLVEIRAKQLRFTEEETTVLLNDVMGLGLPTTDVAAINARTEGWIAGLHLAALSMQDCNDTHSFISAFTGSHSYIMDYLLEEVLKSLSEKVRLFLLETSILDRMCGQLCESVISWDATDPISGQAMLEALEEDLLFIVPLDQERRWYRYHQLFKDVLNRRLESQFPRLMPELHRRAALWYEQNDFIHEAVDHALLAGDQDYSASLVERHGCSLLMQGEITILSKWLDAIEPYVHTRPWLAVQKSWVLILTGRLERAEQTIQVGEQLLTQLEMTSDVRTMQGSFTAARAQLANMRTNAPLAADFARMALSCLPETTDFTCSLRSVSTSILGDASWISGELDEARRAYTDAVRIGQAADNPHMVIIANINLAGILAEQGQLHQAVNLYKENLQITNQLDGQNSPFADKIFFGLGSIYYEYNQLELARQYTQQCIQLCQQWTDLNLLTKCYILMARLEFAQQNMEPAKEAAQSAERLLNDCQLSPRERIGVQASLACLWLSQGNPQKALLLIQDSTDQAQTLSMDTFENDIEIPYLQEPTFLTFLRQYLAQGNYDTALALSERLLSKAEANHRTGLLIEILVLRAIVFQNNKQATQAYAALERAITLAQPEGYTRVFLDEGEPLAKLLFQAKSHGIASEYASKLLSTIISAASLTNPLAKSSKTRLVEIETVSEKNSLIEPLSERELEVLRLIEAGFSNPDIAAKLVISVKTVKRHISNIYGKLGVKSRTQAVSFARELKILH
jgi:LuxR family maltose regulon positive regulatory protein